MQKNLYGVMFMCTGLILVGLAGIGHLLDPLSRDDGNIPLYILIGGFLVFVLGFSIYFRKWLLGFKE